MSFERLLLATRGGDDDIDKNTSMLALGRQLEDAHWGHKRYDVHIQAFRNVVEEAEQDLLDINAALAHSKAGVATCLVKQRKQQEHLLALKRQPEDANWGHKRYDAYILAYRDELEDAEQELLETNATLAHKQAAVARSTAEKAKQETQIRNMKECLQDVIDHRPEFPV